MLTLLIHLGYLAYDDETKTVHIPNEEIRMEFARSVREIKRDETIRRVRESEQLICDTIHGNAEAVAARIEKVHAEETAVLFYNNEQALRSVIKLAYFSYRDQILHQESVFLSQYNIPDSKAMGTFNLSLFRIIGKLSVKDEAIIKNCRDN